MGFHFQGGACNTFGPKVLLCFGSRRGKTCHRLVSTCLTMIYLNNLSFDGQKYESVASSKHWHLRTGGLANYQGKALTTGCYPDRWDSRHGSLKCNVTTELFDMETLTWSEGPDFPFTDK